MGHLRERFAAKLRNLQIKLRIDTKYQIAAYILALLVVFLIVYSVISWPFGSNEGFSSVDLKECFNKRADQNNDITSVSITNQGNDINIAYDFTQKCYSNLDLFKRENSGSIDVVFAVDDLKEDCFCDTRFKGILNNHEPGEIVVSLIKRSGKVEYKISSKELTIQG